MPHDVDWPGGVAGATSRGDAATGGRAPRGIGGRIAIKADTLEEKITGTDDA